jgi:RNA polymerase sigma-70 factor (ECF subfamily)
MSEHGKLAAAFLAAVPEPSRTAFSQLADLEERLARLLASARAAWSGVGLADEAFAAYLAERLPSTAAEADALDALHGEDLYLACACAAGDHAAVRLFETTFAREVDIALAGMGLDAAVGDEVRQILRTKLFVSIPGAHPKIATYSGRGDLRSWVRAAAVRTAISLLRGQGREVPVPDDMLGAVPAPIDDPHLAHYKELYRAEFKQAFEAAFAALQSRDRTLLRYKFVDGLSLDEIGAIYGVHRATVARWLATTRDALLTGTRAGLRARLAIGDSDLDSIMRLIDSQLEASISGQLQG